MEFRKTNNTSGKKRRTGEQKHQSRQNASSKKKNTQTIDPSHFIKKTATSGGMRYSPSRQINELPVHGRIITNLEKKGYTIPTEIQDKTLEPILEGKDIIGLAQTGTGKTGAFLIPLINNLMEKSRSFHIMIVTPTRELALQIESEFKSISDGLDMYSACLIGGTSIQRDLKNLRRQPSIVIGTPGRIADMVRQRALDMTRFKILVLDEFDRLLDMGFSPEIQKLTAAMVNRRQTILFSATEDKTQKELIRSMVSDPVEVRVRKENSGAENIEQGIIQVREGESKMNILINLLKDNTFDKVLVFTETKRGVSRIYRDLRNAGITVDEIHGDKSQNYRNKALDSFRKKKIKVLVATDVAARGLDITNVTHVINYMPPKNMESYIHRIGRTGRAGAFGKALTFIN